MSIRTLLGMSPAAEELSINVRSIEVPTEDYVRLATKLGIAVGKEKMVGTIEAVLQAEMIQVYSLRDVSAYMNRKTPRGKVWGWTPLRGSDRKRCKGQVVFGFNDRSGRFMDGIYDKPIPLAVLLTIDRIEEATKDFPEIAKPAFFVTDYAVRSPDPFLMVATPGTNPIQEQEPHGHLWNALKESCFVIERWDEPSFR